MTHDLLTSLPNELLHEIVRFLPFVDKYQLSITSRRFRSLLGALSDLRLSRFEILLLRNTAHLYRP